MRTFAHIIVERHLGHWSAWFHGLAQVACGGEWPTEAIERLLQTVGSDRFDVDEVMAIDEATRDDHLEFRIPYRNRRRLPVPSIN
jgi:hypothetical protein